MKFKQISRYLILAMWLVLACVGIGLAGAVPVNKNKRDDLLGIKPKTEIVIDNQINEEKTIKN